MSNEQSKEFERVVKDVEKFGRGRDRGYRARCGDCDEHSEARATEWKYDVYATPEEMEYVAKMRAWNCCNGDIEPADGFPEDPKNEE